MDCTQEMPLLIELGILPCLVPYAITVHGSIFIFLKYLSQAKLRQYSNDEVIAAFSRTIIK